MPKSVDCTPPSPTQHLLQNLCSENQVVLGQRKTSVFEKSKESFPKNI